MTPQKFYPAVGFHSSPHHLIQYWNFYCKGYESLQFPCPGALVLENLMDFYTPWNLQAQAMNSMGYVLLGTDKEQSSLMLKPAENVFHAEVPLIQQMVPCPLWLFQCYLQDNTTSGADNYRSWFSPTFQSHLKKDVLHNKMHQLGLGCIVWELWFTATKAKQSQCHTGMPSQV